MHMSFIPEIRVSHGRLVTPDQDYLKPRLPGARSAPGVGNDPQLQVG